MYLLRDNDAPDVADPSRQFRLFSRSKHHFSRRAHRAFRFAPSALIFRFPLLFSPNLLTTPALHGKIQRICQCLYIYFELCQYCGFADSMRKRKSENFSGRKQTGSFVPWQSERLPFRQAGAAQNFRVGEKGIGIFEMETDTQRLLNFDAEAQPMLNQHAHGGQAMPGRTGK